jgi:Ca-activated chloride channel homolog
MNQELVDEVTYLAKRYGIITPYTSYLVTDDVAGKIDPNQPPGGVVGKPGLGVPGAPPVVFNRRAQAEAVRDAFGKGQNGERAEEGQRAVKKAKELAGSRTASSRSGGAAAFGDAADRYIDEKARQNGGRGRSSLQALRYIGSRSFYNFGGVWYEGTYDVENQKDLKKIEVGSDDYFALLKKDGRVAKYLALGDVVVRVGKTWYHIASPEKKKTPEPGSK